MSVQFDTNGKRVKNVCVRYKKDHPRYSRKARKTEQSHKHLCDIHRIVQGAERTGIVDHVTKRKGNYDNLVGAVDFHQAMNILAQGQQSFEALPPEVRKKFHNDAHEFLSFMENEDNRDEIIALGFDDLHLPPVPDVVEPTGGSVEPIGGDDSTDK